MEYSRFLEKMQETLQQRAGGQVRVTLSKSLKNNRDEVDSIAILEDGRNTSPAFYMDQYYILHLQGRSTDELAEDILDLYRRSAKEGVVDFSFYTDFGEVQKSLACKLIHYEKNETLLAQVPHRRFLNLAVVYYCRVDHGMLGNGSILVQNSHMRMWGTDEETLYSIAYENTGKLLPFELFALSDLLEEVFNLEEEQEDGSGCRMYVLTNTEKYFGAVNIIYPGVLEEIGDFLEQDFYVLPSSIHECMIVPADSSPDVQEMFEMVRDINKEHVAAEEILADSVYFYDKKKKQLTLLV